MPIKPFAAIFCLILIFAFIRFAEGKPAFATKRLDKIQNDFRADELEQSVIDKTSRIVEEIVRASFPELRNASIRIKTFNSRTDYLRARFSLVRFLTFRQHQYLIFINPQVFEKNAPSEGLRAIIAHELAHVAYYRRHNRFELFGLLSLESKSFTARFERGADLQAIKRGYGAGLKIYREWLYQNIPAKQIAAKKRDYFSPAEIELIDESIRAEPALMDFWIKNVPRNFNEIQTAVKNRK